MSKGREKEEGKELDKELAEGSGGVMRASSGALGTAGIKNNKNGKVFGGFSGGIFTSKDVKTDVMQGEWIALSQIK